MEPITLIFSGDLAPVARMEEACRKGIHEAAISKIKPFFQPADLHITNLECCLTSSEQAITKTGPALKADPVTVSLLKSLNAGLVCLANNHIRDYGDQGLKDTLDVCKSNGIDTVGAGKNIEAASAVCYREIKGRTIAFLNYCEEEFSIATDKQYGANHLDLIRIWNDLKAAKKVTPLVFVVLHGGHEEYNLPSPRIRDIFHYIADLGATAVIGHHPHVISGMEVYNGVPLVYSLGNFIFDEPGNSFPGWYTGAVLKIIIHPDNTLSREFSYLEEDRKELHYQFLEGSAYADTISKCDQLSKIISDDEKLKESWNAFARKFELGYVKQALHLSLFKRALYKAGFFRSIIIRRKDLVPLLNLVQCEAHRDLLIHSIKKQIQSSD